MNASPFDKKREHVASGGCSALSYETRDGKHLFARNYDCPSAQGASVIFIPRNLEIPLLQHKINAATMTTRLACLGMGCIAFAAPLLFDGVNEKGLCGGMLHYSHSSDSEPVELASHSINSSFYLTALLSSCGSVEDAVTFVREHALSKEELIVGLPTQYHYFLTDSTGEALIIEPDEQGLNVFRHSIGVLTNAPSYSWHLINLRNYLTVRSSQPMPQKILGDNLKPLSVGAGGLGLPGDFTSPSRFVRLAFAKDALPEAKDERDGVTKVMSALGCVTIPQGFTHNGEGFIEETLYSAAMCSESKKYYVTLFSNRRLTSYSLDVELKGHEIKQFTLPLTQDIAMGNF